MQEASYLESATWRYIFGVGTLLVLSLKSIQTLTLKGIPLKGIFLVGFVGLFGFNVFFFLGLQYTPPVSAALIISLNPILTIWLSALLLKTAITKYHMLGAGLALIGVVLLLSKGNYANFLSLKLSYGDLLIMVANVIFALHHVWVKQYRGHFSNRNFTLLTNLVCLLGFLCLLPINTAALTLDHSGYYWLWAVGIGTFGTAVAYLLWNEGVQQLGADQAGVFMNVVPLATALAAVLLGASLEYYHLISGVIIAAGIVISQKKVLQPAKNQ